jgi:hypothetical protein
MSSSNPELTIIIITFFVLLLEQWSLSSRHWTDHELAQCSRHANSQVRCITASIIESTFRMAAAHVCKLDPVKDCEHLRKWSSHSVRIGASVILHGMGFTDSQIKLLLRWRSDDHRASLQAVPCSPRPVHCAKLYLIMSRTTPDSVLGMCIFFIFFQSAAPETTWRTSSGRATLALPDQHSLAGCDQPHQTWWACAARELSRNSFSS